MTRLHADQIDSDERLVKRLLADQFPQWSGLPVTAVTTSGTENAIYRLGSDMVVRLPYRPARTEQVDKLDRWLPELARHLPLAVPETLARGVPSEAFPAAWSVLRWLEGEEVTLSGLSDPVASAVTLAGFVRALLAIHTAGGPSPGEHNFWRGVPLVERDEMTRRAIQASKDLIDVTAVTRAWERDLGADIWRRPPTWLHGDLAPDNLLHREGRLTAVIDWGGLGVGDPATELLPAWNLFRGESRQAYREALEFDDATWARGRGLALSTAIVALPYYRTTIPVRAERAMQVIREVLADHLEN